MAVVRYLFVYGTLLASSKHPMARWLRRHARYCGPARFRGALYSLGSYPGAVASSDAADWVFGDLFLLRHHSLLKRLDCYEGCDGRSCVEYRRRVAQVSWRGVEVAAWIYLYARPLRRSQRIDSGNWCDSRRGQRMMSSSISTAITMARYHSA